ncbi:virion core protein, T7 gp14 family [Aquincola tertiaricarbonis]|uniref:virion core protein, T7 gp14 family n=1 Tax=Aquincola tertiaricarbonis TaxID=391953 RepID=UPI0012EDA9E8|nr:hypothetical protein [Aquincola tertiaricarbonis]
MSYFQGTSNAKTAASNIKTAAEQQQMDLERQNEQQRQAAAGEMNEHAQRLMKDNALFDVVTGEYGGGNTAERSRAVASVQGGEQMATLSSNAQSALQENSFAASAASTRANAQLASIQRPSLFGTALQIGGGAVNAYTGYLKYKAPAVKDPS